MSSNTPSMPNHSLPTELQDKIAGIFYFTAADGVRGKGLRTHTPNQPPLDASLMTTVFCVITMFNGNTYTGVTSLRSGNVFNEKIATAKAKEKAIRKAIEEYRKQRST